MKAPLLCYKHRDLSVRVVQQQPGGHAAGAEGESFIVTVNGRAIADVVPHRNDIGRRRFVPVVELVEAFSADLAPDPTTWLADLAAADEIFGSDDPANRFCCEIECRRVFHAALLDTLLLIDFPTGLIAEVAEVVRVFPVTIAKLQYGVTAAPGSITQICRQ